jgi:hypothetical protein
LECLSAIHDSGLVHNGSCSCSRIVH